MDETNNLLYVEDPVKPEKYPAQEPSRNFETSGADAKCY